jgi:DNA-binding NtrC family response regulator
MERCTVLYVDDEQRNLDAFVSCFRRDFNVITALSAKEAREKIIRYDIHVLITDQRMPNENGTILLSEAYSKHPNITRILLTGYSDIEALIEAVNIGHIYAFMQKPWDIDHLKKKIEDAYLYCMIKRKKDLHQKELEAANIELEKALNNKNLLL